MGLNVKEKSIRNARKHRHATVAATLPPPDPVTAAAGGNLNPDPNPNPSPNHCPNLPNPNPNGSLDDASWGLCTEEQLEELLLKNLDFVYKEALSRLIALGYDEPLAHRAVLRNGHCYGSMDVRSNILHNAIAFLNSSAPDASPSPESAAAAFSDLRHLQEYSLAGLVSLLQQVRPNLTRSDAMWCLLMSELNVPRATSIELPLGMCRLYDPKRKVLNRPKLSRGPDDVVETVLKDLESMSIKEDDEEEEEKKAEEEEKERILSMIQQIRDLVTQVKERKEWAQQKAMQAVKKLGGDYNELRELRREREENQRVKKGKQAPEETTMTRLSEMENGLKKASGQVDRANTAVRRLDNENAEIKAEMEASKLSASESVNKCLAVAKRENKLLKRLLAWEKQTEKVREEAAEEKEKIVEMQSLLSRLKESQKENEMRWRLEAKAKEQATTLFEEERRAKEAAQATLKRNHEALCRKIEVDFQRHKDDIRRLEEELSRLRASTGSTVLDSDEAKPAKEINKKLGQGFNNNKPGDLNRRAKRNKECIVCKKEEVNVVFLPCAHQVLCVGCSEDQERSMKANCPCCNVKIDERIRVFGTRSMRESEF